MVQTYLTIRSHTCASYHAEPSPERQPPGARARQLAEVALAVYEAGAPGIHLPLDGGHLLVAVLRRALEREARERPGKEWQVRWKQRMRHKL